MKTSILFPAKSNLVSNKIVIKSAAKISVRYNTVTTFADRVTFEGPNPVAWLDLKKGKPLREGLGLSKAPKLCARAEPERALNVRESHPLQSFGRRRVPWWRKRLWKQKGLSICAVFSSLFSVCLSPICLQTSFCPFLCSLFCAWLFVLFLQPSFHIWLILHQSFANLLYNLSLSVHPSALSLSLW